MQQQPHRLIGWAVRGGPETAFHCLRCGACCFGRGGVRLHEEEAELAARHLNLTGPDFQRLYLAGGPPPWDIRTGEDGFCLLHRPDGLCLIHAVKPEVCRRWPFLPGLLKWESVWEEAKAACPGLRTGCGWAGFKAAGAAFGAQDGPF